MERIPMVSSNIASAGYENGILEVEFTSGALYGYSATPEEWEAFQSAPSAGKYFAQHFKTRAFSRR